MKKFSDMSYLKKRILIVSIIIVVIIIIMIIMNLLQKEAEWQEEKKELDKGNAPRSSFEKEIVTNHSTFFSVGNAIQKYLTSISIDIEKISPEPIRGSNMRSAISIYATNQGITDEYTKKEAIYNFLNPEYIKEKGITQDNIINKIQINDSVTFYPLKMYQIIKNNVTQYAVYGKTQDIETQDEIDRYFIVDEDKGNKAFYITPVEYEKYEDVENIPLEGKDEKIEQNNNNFFSYTIMQENDIAQKYFTYFKTLMQKQPEQAYYLLEEEYRNKRFGNIEEFVKYVVNNKESIKEYIAKEYEKNELENETQYICQDQYKHSYIFTVTAVMQFQVKLDTYTIESEETQQKYQVVDERRKVEMNVDKWIQMINCRDYKTAYEVLDESFKSEYFPTLERFEEYMRQKFPYYYGINLAEFSQEAGVYIQRLLLTDITAKNKMTIPETFIMKLTEQGFIMSFRVLS